MHVCMHIFFMHVSAYFRILSVILFQEETGLNPNISNRCSGLHVLLSIYPHCSMCITYTDTLLYLIMQVGYAHDHMYVVTRRHTQLICFIDY